MTNEEAIARIRKIAEASAAVSDTGSFERRPITEALEMAIEALGKQIPRKPVCNDEDPYQWYCPLCKSIIGVDGQDPENDWCCDCGQHLKWSEK